MRRLSARHIASLPLPRAHRASATSPRHPPCPRAQALPAGWRVLGRLTYTVLPHVVRLGSKSGFAEMSDDFDF